MSAAAKRLRARIAVVPKRERGGRRYGADLKRAVVEYAFTRQGEHATIHVIAEELGLSTGLLGKWLRHARLRLSKGKSPANRHPCPGAINDRPSRPRRLVPLPPRLFHPAPSLGPSLLGV